MRGFRALLLLVICGLAVSACAYGPPTRAALEARDPYEQMNRDTLRLNAKVDKYFVVPTVGLYFILVPEPGRKGVHNFLGNLSLPIIFVNDMLQGEVTRGAQSVGRLVVNSTLGLGGFFDPATKMGIPGHGEDMGQTFAVWGAREGPYLVLPFLGPSSPRDAAGLALDWTVDPTNFIPMKQHVWWAAGRGYFTLLDLRSQTWETVQGIQRKSVDYYASLRNFYRQYRNEQIRNGRSEVAPAELPDF